MPVYGLASRSNGAFIDILTSSRRHACTSDTRIPAYAALTFGAISVCGNVTHSKIETWDANAFGLVVRLLLAGSTVWTCIAD